MQTWKIYAMQKLIREIPKVEKWQFTLDLETWVKGIPRQVDIPRGKGNESNWAISDENLSLSNKTRVF